MIYDRISLEELMELRLLKIPDIDEVLLIKDLKNGHRFKNTGGVYLFYNSHKEPLYVGISHNLAKRIPEHIASLKGNKDLVKYLESKEDVFVAVFYEPDKANQELYESYLIKILNPRFNISKTGREKI